MTEPERTDDGRYLIVNGRRWRAEDPQLDPDVAAALRKHLGRGRSGVRVAGRRDDEVAVRAARDRVQLAKEGLGERGTVWWELTAEQRHERAADRLARLARLDRLDRLD